MKAIENQLCSASKVLERFAGGRRGGATPSRAAERDCKFAQAVQRAVSKIGAKGAGTDLERKLSQGRYLGLFLFGLFNPVIESMRGLCAITDLSRVQEEISGVRVSQTSFSEVQHVTDSALSQEVFKELASRAEPEFAPDPSLTRLKLIAQDGSLWRALPRMAWAQYGDGRDGEANGVRRHLRFNLVEGKPEEARVQAGKSCGH